MATPPPTPPSPPERDGTPDGGNPSRTAPPKVAPEPGRQSARGDAGGAGKSATKRQTSTRAKSTKKQSAGKEAAGNRSAAPKPPSPSRAPAKPRAAARPRPRTTKISVATAPSRRPVDAETTASPKSYRRSWWRVVAGGVGALAAGAALLSLRGSARRKAYQADESDSSKTFDAGIADKAAPPDTPAQP